MERWEERWKRYVRVSVCVCPGEGKEEEKREGKYIRSQLKVRARNVSEHPCEYECMCKDMRYRQIWVVMEVPRT